MKAKRIYRQDGTQAKTSTTNRRRGKGSSQKNAVKRDGDHLKGGALHFLHAALNETRDANPVFRVRSRAVEEAKAALREHVRKLHLYLPSCEKFRYFGGEKQGLLPVTDERHTELFNGALDRMFFFRWEEKKKCWARRELRGQRDGEGEVSPLQTMRIQTPIPQTLFMKEMVKKAASIGPEEFEKAQELSLTWGDDFNPAIRDHFVEWTSTKTLEDGSPDPDSACEVITIAEHWDTALPHKEVAIAEEREVEREVALGMGINPDRPFGKKLERFLRTVLRDDPDLLERVRGRVFLRVGTPQLGRQGPDMQGLHLMTKAGFKLDADNARDYEAKLDKGRRSKAENGRAYGPSGLGIDTSLNDKYYDYCRDKAASLGMAKAWEEAEAAYRDWLTEALPLKARLEKEKQVAQIQFDEDQKSKASVLREHEVRSMKRQIQLDLCVGRILSGKEMEDLAKAHKIDKIAGMIVDGYDKGDGPLTLGKLLEVARKGLQVLINFLSDLWTNGIGLRSPIGDRLADPDYLADVTASVAAELEVAKKALKPVIQEIIRTEVKTEVVREVVERKVFIDVQPDEDEWDECRRILKGDLSLKVPLVRMAVGERAVGMLNFDDPKWKGTGAAYKAQYAIVKAAVDRRRALHAKLVAERDAQMKTDAAAAAQKAETQRKIEAGELVVGEWQEEAPEKVAERLRDRVAINRTISNLIGYMGPANGALSQEEYSSIAKKIVGSPDPEARERRVARLIHACLKGKDNEECWQPKNLQAMLAADAHGQIKLPLSGEVSEIQM